jgi:hypothetical protein
MELFLKTPSIPPIQETIQVAAGGEYQLSGTRDYYLCSDVEVHLVNPGDQ